VNIQENFRREPYHCTAIAETSSKDLRCLNTESILSYLDKLVNEGYVLTASIAPAIVETLRRNEDGTFVGQSS
jgi:hypothetical protein